MYGQFGGMQQSMEKLSREIRVEDRKRNILLNWFIKLLNNNKKACVSAGCQCTPENVGVWGEGSYCSHGELWSDEQLPYICKHQPAGNKWGSCEDFYLFDSCMLLQKPYVFFFPSQKSLLENCQNRVDVKDEVKSLRSTYEKTQEKLRDKERELAAAQAENQTLRLQVILQIHACPKTFKHLLQLMCEAGTPMRGCMPAAKHTDASHVEFLCMSLQKIKPTIKITPQTSTSSIFLHSRAEIWATPASPSAVSICSRLLRAVLMCCALGCPGGVFTGGKHPRRAGSHRKAPERVRGKTAERTTETQRRDRKPTGLHSLLLMLTKVCFQR